MSDRPCGFFHRWREEAFRYPWEIAERCEKCRWWRVFNGLSATFTLYPPDSLQIEKDDAR